MGCYEPLNPRAVRVFWDAQDTKEWVNVAPSRKIRVISDLRALAQPWGWFAAPLHSQGLHSRQNQLLLTATKRRVPVWERNRQWDSQNSLGFYLLNPLCFNPLPSKWFYFYLKMHLAKVKITGVSQALLEPLRIAFTFVYFLNLK